MKNKALMSEYYNLPAWIIREFGFSREMGAYLIIYNFCRQGKQCYYSKAQWAQLLNCTQMQAIRILKALEAENYIISERRKSSAGNNCLSTLYRINEETAQELQAVEPSNMDVTTPSNMDVTTPSNMDVTTPSNMDVTQSEYINQNNKNQNNISESVCARAGESALVSIPNFERIQVTQAESDILRYGIKYADGKSLAGYCAAYEERTAAGKVYPSPFLIIRKWATQDGGKLLSEKEMRRQQEQAESFDMYAELVNNF